MTLIDKLKNNRVLFAADLAALGFPSELVVEGITDTEPPTLTSFDFNPKVIDTTLSSQEIQVSVSATDDLSGVDLIFITLRNASQSQVCRIWADTGNCTLTFPQLSALGAYDVRVQLFDSVGNQIILQAADVAALGFPSEVFNGNTPAGINTTITIDNTEITYSEVTEGGQTTVVTSTSGSQPPSGFKLGNPPAYFNISTTAQFVSPVTICTTYDESQFHGQEKNLKIFHFEGGNFVNVTTSLDTILNIICAEVQSFSEFVLLTPFTSNDLILDIKNLDLEKGIEQSLIKKLDAVKKAIDELQPDIVICGHVHEGAGAEEFIGKTKVVNVACTGKIIEP